MASYLGHSIKFSVFGESRGASVGMSMEGLPAGVPIDLTALQQFLDRRAPGRNPWSSARKEADRPQFLSGLCEGVTTGEPLCAVLANTDADPAPAPTVLRPGHADWPAFVKYGEIPPGGGKFSGRLTAPVCIAGGICLQLLNRSGIEIGAHILCLSDIGDTPFDPMQPALSALAGKDFPVLDEAAGHRMIERIMDAKQAEDSVGGVIECAVTGLPVGLGDHLWDGMESRIAQLVFGIPAIRGVQFGNGFAAVALRGTQNNDPLCLKDGVITAQSNRHGGILGGMTTGLPLLFTAAVKPTPSVGSLQQTVDVAAMREAEICTKGRNDACIVPRAVPVIEAAAALAVYDALQESERQIGI